MNRILLCVILGLVFLSCTKNQTKQETESLIPERIETDNTPKDVSDDFEKTKELERKYPKEMEDIWGNFDFLEKMKEYNSIFLAEKSLENYANTDIRIDSVIIVFDHPHLMEPQILDSKYTSILLSSDSLVLRNTETNLETFYKKIKNIPDQSSVWHLFGVENSAIDIMQYQWFMGTYQLYDVIKDTTNTVCFDKDGQMSGENGNLNYYLGYL